MHTAYKILPHYTYEDYRRWEGQWELIDGILYAMSPAPRPNTRLLPVICMLIFVQLLKKRLPLQSISAH